MSKIHVKVVLDVVINTDDVFNLTEYMECFGVEAMSSSDTADVEDVKIVGYEVTDSR